MSGGRTRAAGRAALALALALPLLAGSVATVSRAQPAQPELRPQGYLPIGLNADIVGKGALVHAASVAWHELDGGRPLDQSLLVRGELAYVGLWDRKADRAWIEVLDLGDPERPRRVGRSAPIALGHEDACDCMDLAREGDLLLAAASMSGLRTLDLADPRRPRWVGSFATALDAYAVAVEGRRAVLFERGSSDVSRPDADERLWSLDVSDPTAPRPLGSFVPSGRAPSAVALDGGLAVTVAHRDPIRVFDVRHEGDPRLVASLERELAQDVALAEGLLVTAHWGPSSDASSGVWTHALAGDGALGALDSWRPRRAPEFLRAERVALDGRFLYAATDGHPDGGLLAALDAADPARLVESATIGEHAGDVRWVPLALAASDGMVVLTTDSHVHVYRHLRR